MITLTMQAMHFFKNLFIIFFFLLSSFKSGFFLYLFNCLFLFLLPCTELGGSNRWQNWKMGMLQAFHKYDVLKPICWIAHSLSLPASYVHEQSGQVLLNFCQLFIFLLYLFSYYCFQMRNQARKWASKVFGFLKVNPPFPTSGFLFLLRWTWEHLKKIFLVIESYSIYILYKLIKLHLVRFSYGPGISMYTSFLNSCCMANQFV